MYLVLCTVVEIGVPLGGGPKGRGGQPLFVGGKGRELSHMSQRKSEKKFFMAWICTIEKKMAC